MTIRLSPPVPYGQVKIALCCKERPRFLSSTVPRLAMAAYLLLRGMKTLHLRLRQQNETALRIAQYLQTHPAISQVFYPGLETHEHHDIAVRQMRGFGGVLSFTLQGGFDAVRLFLPRLHYAHRAANLGAVETIVGTPATTSHVESTPQEREAMGIPEGLIRYSVGIEDPDDLLADLQQALSSVTDPAITRA